MDKIDGTKTSIRQILLKAKSLWNFAFRTFSGSITIIKTKVQVSVVIFSLAYFHIRCSDAQNPQTEILESSVLMMGVGSMVDGHLDMYQMI